MKKGMIVLAIVLLLAGCGKKEAVQTSSDTTGGKEDQITTSVSEAAKEPTEGFQFIYNDVTIPMNVDVAPILEKLGKESSYFEAASCAFQGLDKTYSYSGFDLTTYPLEDKDFVATVNFLDDSVTTDKGICLGSTLEDVTKAYGEDYAEESGEYTYTLGDTKLAFIIEDDAVASITYSAIVEGLN